MINIETIRKLINSILRVIPPKRRPGVSSTEYVLVRRFLFTVAIFETRKIHICRIPIIIHEAGSF